MWVGSCRIQEKAKTLIFKKSSDVISFDIKPAELKCVRKESDREVYLGMSHLTDVSFCQKSHVSCR